LHKLKIEGIFESYEAQMESDKVMPELQIELDPRMKKMMDSGSTTTSWHEPSGQMSLV
jgi:hypothetical protein